MEKVFVVTLTEHENGGHAQVNLVGVFDNKDQASETINNLFHKMCDKYGVEELNNYSFFNEGEDFNIEGDDLMFEAFASIECVELNKTYHNYE